LVGAGIVQATVPAKIGPAFASVAVGAARNTYSYAPAPAPAYTPEWWFNPTAVSSWHSLCVMVAVRVVRWKIAV